MILSELLGDFQICPWWARKFILAQLFSMGSKIGVQNTFQFVFARFNGEVGEKGGTSQLVALFGENKKMLQLENVLFCEKNLRKHCFWKKGRSPKGRSAFFCKKVFSKIFSQKKVFKLKHFCYFPKKSKRLRSSTLFSELHH